MHDEPPYQHEPRRHGDHANDDDEDEEHVDAYPRVQHEIGAKHAGDGAGCPDGWHGRPRLHQDVSRGSREAADEIEREKARRSHAVFDVVSEHPEKESVAEDVTPAAMQEHRRQRRKLVDGIVVDHAVQPACNGHSQAKRRAVGELAWHHSVVADALGELQFVESGALRREPDGEHRAEEGPRHYWRVQRRILVAEWNHWPCWRACVTNVTALIPAAAILAQTSGLRLASPHRHRRSERVSKYALRPTSYSR